MGNKTYKPLTYEQLEEALKKLSKPKKAFSLIAYCNTRRHVIDYGEPEIGLCSDKTCYWCAELKKGMREAAKKITDGR